MMKRMKTVSLLASVMMSVLMAPVPAAQAADDVREVAAQACLASSSLPAASSQESSDEEAVSRHSETQVDTRGYCTGDCSPCTLKTYECLKRGQGSCTALQLCRQESAQ